VKLPWYRRDMLHFLSDDLQGDLRTNVSKLSPTGELGWVSKVRKLAVGVEDHFKPVSLPPSHGLNSYHIWVTAFVSAVIAKFTSLRRLYIVLDVHRPGCTLPFHTPDPTLMAGQDGFILYHKFLDQHRRARARGYRCQCKLPQHRVPPRGTPASFAWDVMQDVIFMSTLKRSVTSSRLTDSSLRSFNVFWVVDVKAELESKQS
jgi:hypothetical protein